MKRFIGGLFLILSASAVAGDDLKTYVEKLNSQTAKAYKTKDSQFFDNLYPPAFKAHDEHGWVQGRKEYLFVVRFQMNSLKVLDYHAKTEAIKLQKAQGTVITQAKMVGLTPPRHGMPVSKVQISRRWSDLYQRKGNSWELVSRTELATPLVKTVPLTNLVAPKPAH